jgi:hypothetical protein
VLEFFLADEEIEGGAVGAFEEVADLGGGAFGEGGGGGEHWSLGLGCTRGGEE